MSKKVLLLVALVFGISVVVSPAIGQLTDYTRTGGAGTGTWQSSSWSQTGVVHPSPYPNTAFHSANLSGPLAGNLTVNIDGTDPNNNHVTVGPITLGGTSAAATTEIGSVNGGYLLFKNDDD